MAATDHPVEDRPEALLPGLRWRRVFPGEPAQLKEVRAFINMLLAGHPVRDDALVCAVELCANAIAHTASGVDGVLALEVWLSEGRTVRVLVQDAGGPTVPLPRTGSDDAMSEGGRGLAIVAALSARTGMLGDHRGRLVWADLTLREEGAGGATAGLRYDFHGWEVWFGCWTRQWWAIPRGCGPYLISAPSEKDLLRQIDLIERDLVESADHSAGNGDVRIPRQRRPDPEEDDVSGR
ncbi:ATP-binding protein [Sphaerisporangium melleum]|uniref:ATP-binding protein n=1 Tax=Sphaerisporangium melleum TaxID=321316 RepID=UPI0016654558|nr:ATP-binding protein [Sphaerisporangium melleum]